MPDGVLFVKRKVGLSHEEFRAHYEATYAPFAKRRMPHLVRYTRNYVARFPAQPEPPYHCATEYWFGDADRLKATIESTRVNEGQIPARDKENFMDRATTIVRMPVTYSTRAFD